MVNWYDGISNIQNTYIFGKYLFVWAPETAKKASLWQRLQINFTFNDNVCVFCFSCNIKKSKITDYLNYLKIAEAIVIYPANGVIFSTNKGVK
jgi:hypothetical protein